jgi:hypothetical protein
MPLLLPQVHIETLVNSRGWSITNMAGNADVKVLIGDCRNRRYYSGRGSTGKCLRNKWSCRASYLSLDRKNSNMVLQVGGISCQRRRLTDSDVVQKCAILPTWRLIRHARCASWTREALDAIVLAMAPLHRKFLPRVRLSGAATARHHGNFKAMQASNIGWYELLQRDFRKIATEPKLVALAMSSGRFCCGLRGRGES